MTPYRDETPAPWRPQRNPYERLLHRLAVTGHVVGLLSLLAVAVTLGWVVWHAFSIDAWEKVEVVRTVEEVAHPGWANGAFFAGIGVLAAVIGLVVYVADLVERARDRAREWERRQTND